MTTKSTAIKAVRKPAKRENSTFALITELTALAPMSDNELLESLLQDMQEGDDIVEAAPEVAVESGAVAAHNDETMLDDDFLSAMGDDSLSKEADSLSDELQEEDLEAAIEAADRELAKTAMYAAQESSVDHGSVPETTVDEMTSATPSLITAKDLKKAEKAAASVIQKIKREAEKAEKALANKKVPKVPAAQRATSITHEPGALLMVKLGANARDYLSFSMSDIGTMEEADLHAKQDAFIDRMNDRDAIADKVKEKATMFLMWIKNGGELNTVLKRALIVLHETGELTSGDTGNLQLNLLAKPYSVGTARSQANQCFMLFPELSLTLKEKGRMVPNPDSVLLPMAFAKLALK